jgi:hypothetical protein
MNPVRARDRSAFDQRGDLLQLKASTEAKRQRSTSAVRHRRTRTRPRLAGHNASQPDAPIRQAAIGRCRSRCGAEIDRAGDAPQSSRSTTGLAPVARPSTKSLIMGHQLQKWRRFTIVGQRRGNSLFSSQRRKSAAQSVWPFTSLAGGVVAPDRSTRGNGSIRSRREPGRGREAPSRYCDPGQPRRG